MKLPAFSEFIQVRNDEKYAPKHIGGMVSLSENPTHKEVVDFAESTAAYTTMIMLEQYHSWLSEHLTTYDNTR